MVHTVLRQAEAASWSSQCGQQSLIVSWHTEFSMLRAVFHVRLFTFRKGSPGFHSDRHTRHAKDLLVHGFTSRLCIWHSVPESSRIKGWSKGPTSRHSLSLHGHASQQTIIQRMSISLMAQMLLSVMQTGVTGCICTSCHD